MAARSHASATYRFGFNGKENDGEIAGDGNALDFGARIYDSRLGRWMSVDPFQAKFPGFSVYNYAINSPLLFIDKDGRIIKYAIVDDNGNIVSYIESTDIGVKTVVELIQSYCNRSIIFKTMYESLQNDPSYTVVIAVNSNAVNKLTGGAAGAMAVPPKNDCSREALVIFKDNITETTENAITNAKYTSEELFHVYQFRKYGINAENYNDNKSNTADLESEVKLFDNVVVDNMNITIDGAHAGLGTLPCFSYEMRLYVDLSLPDDTKPDKDDIVNVNNWTDKTINSGKRLDSYYSYLDSFNKSRVGGVYSGGEDAKKREPAAYNEIINNSQK